MRPLFHPSIEEITVEGILHALSDPVRVAIYADIVSQECSQNCSTFLKVSDKTIPRSTLSQHFRELTFRNVEQAASIPERAISVKLVARTGSDKEWGMPST